MTALSLNHPAWNALWNELRRLPALAWVWLAFTLLMPIADWLGVSFAVLSTVGVLLHVGASLQAARHDWPWPRLLSVVAVTALLTWLAEFIGHTTGWPFGVYRYTEALQPQVWGVPALIPLAWLMMLIPSWAVTGALVHPRQRLTFAALSGLVFTAWDLYLDPQMVSRGLWLWAETQPVPGDYFGIPLVNFFGWWLVSGVVTWVCHPRDLALSARPLAMIYTLVWVLQVVGLGVFWGQPGPALFGFAAMGLWVALFWRRHTAPA